jgi:hypothetical protein
LRRCGWMRHPAAGRGIRAAISYKIAKWRATRDETANTYVIEINM